MLFIFAKIKLFVKKIFISELNHQLGAQYHRLLAHSHESLMERNITGF